MATFTHCDLCQEVIPDGENVGQVTIKKNQKSNVAEAEAEICEACFGRLIRELSIKGADVTS